MTIEFIKRAVRVGNSAGIILPKKYLNAEVKVTIIKKPIDYKKISLKLLSPYLEDVQAACITNTNPLEIIAITTNTKKILKNSQIKVSFVPKQIFIKDYNSIEILRKKIKIASYIINKDFFEKL